MKKYKLEKRDGNEWSLYGIYTERSLPQLVQAAVQLSKTGYEMYGNLHIVEIKHRWQNSYFMTPTTDMP